VSLLRARAAVLALEHREHLLARATGAMAGARQLVARMGAPAVRVLVGVGGHGLDPSETTANENGLQ
jgi:hypothetical protein